MTSYLNKIKIFIVINEDRFFLSHRKEIAVSALRRGYDVTLVAKNTGFRSDVEKLGIRMIELPINPTGENIFEELKTLIFLFRLYQRLKPDIVHHVGLKNILWGSLAAKFAKVRGVVNAVSGLGILFSQERPSIIAKMILKVLCFSHRRDNVVVIFQNEEDKILFLENGIIKTSNARFIKGSGVDLNEFSYSPEPDSFPIKVIFTARMVVEKGVFILIDAAERLRNLYKGKVQFLLCGGLSNNPKAIKENELLKCCDGNYIQWLGHRSDVLELLKQSHIVCFPSYYREGVPKSLIEATAIGRPIITTNSIGCKDTVEDGFNGFLVPIKDSVTLADKLTILIDNKSLRETMGMNSRKIAERDFSLDNVVRSHLEIYQELLQ